ncbi:FliA/WhiG family RNA polymerase sigma factor, partial [Bacillus velezensis]
MQSLNYEDQVLWSRWKEWKDPKAGDDLMRRYMPLVT